MIESPREGLLQSSDITMSGVAIYPVHNPRGWDPICFTGGGIEGPNTVGLRVVQTSTPAEVTSSGRHRSSGGTLLKILPGNSPPLPKFPPSPPTISVWHCQTPQKNLASASPSPCLQSNGAVAALSASS